MRTDNAPVIRLEDYRPPDYLIDTVDLNVRLEPNATLVRSRLSIRRRDGADPKAPLHLDGDGLSLLNITLDREEIEPEACTASPDRLTLHAPPASFQLEIVTSLDPDANKALMGLYRSNGVYTTQCEAEGFRRITYFLDRPDVLAVYTTRIEADRQAAPILLGNGNLVESGDVPGAGRHYAVWRDPFPKPSYLFALVGGDLSALRDSFTTASGRNVDLAIWCEHGKVERCGYAMDALKRSMRWDEQRFGREYDLDVFNIVAVSDFNMGAMENKGLNIFNDKYVLVDSETGTDGDHAGVETVIAHEYFHNWTGNRITCRDWFQLCLKEGLTVFRDQEFSADMRSAPVKRIADVRGLRQSQFPEDAGPLAHPPRPSRYREINNFYTATVYQKGAEICRMLQTLLGRDGFRAGMDLYFERHDGEAATVEQFLACFEDAAGRDLSQFGIWYRQAGTPTVRIACDFDAEANRFTIDLRQDWPAAPDAVGKEPLHIPIAFGLVGGNGQDLTFGSAEGAQVEGGVIHLTGAQARVVFENVAERPVPSLFRAFSAPVRVEADLAPDDLVFLVGHDPDPFNRWQATQTIATSILVRAATSNNEPDTALTAGFAAALARLADDDRLDPAFRALALALPSAEEIAFAVGSDVDPDAIESACGALRRQFGAAIGDVVMRAASRNPPASSYDPGAEQAGRRALAHAGLALCASAGLIASDEVHRHFSAADNLTDRLAALRLLSHLDLPHAPDALQAFEQRYRGTPLVLDKWFAVQAMAPFPWTLERAKALTEHPAFSLATPNRVYALVRTFAANPVAFHRADGEGYRWLADVISTLDPTNPSVAARLATVFRSFRIYEPVRRALAEAALASIRDGRKLSRDVGDIVDRTLAG